MNGQLQSNTSIRIQCWWRCLRAKKVLKALKIKYKARLLIEKGKLKENRNRNEVNKRSMIKVNRPTIKSEEIIQESLATKKNFIRLVSSNNVKVKDDKTKIYINSILKDVVYNVVEEKEKKEIILFISDLVSSIIKDLDLEINTRDPLMKNGANLTSENECEMKEESSLNNIEAELESVVVVEETIKERVENIKERTTKDPTITEHNDLVLNSEMAIEEEAENIAKDQITIEHNILVVNSEEPIIKEEPIESQRRRVKFEDEKVNEEKNFFITAPEPIESRNRENSETLTYKDILGNTNKILSKFNDHNLIPKTNNPNAHITVKIKRFNQKCELSIDLIKKKIGPLCYIPYLSSLDPQEKEESIEYKKKRQREEKREIYQMQLEERAFKEYQMLLDEQDKMLREYNKRINEIVIVEIRIENRKRQNTKMQRI